MSKIYLAAAFDRQEELKQYASDLKSLGHEVTSTWLEEETIAAKDITSEVGRMYATRDKQEVERSDALILFTEELPSERVLTGGRLVEAGIALGIGLKITIIGPRENVFCHFPRILQFNSWSDYMRYVDKEQFEEV